MHEQDEQSDSASLLASQHMGSTKQRAILRIIGDDALVEYLDCS